MQVLCHSVTVPQATIPRPLYVDNSARISHMKKAEEVAMSMFLDFADGIPHVDVSDSYIYLLSQLF